MDNIISRPDRAEDIAGKQNSEYFPPVVREITPTFGVEKKVLHIYNVSALNWETGLHGISRPPNFPHIFFLKCPREIPWIRVAGVDHPFPQRTETPNGDTKIEYVDGYREVTRLLAPMNPGVDQNWSDPTTVNVGDNLNDYGIFWSEHNPPLDSEVAAAKARLEATYRKELARMAAIESENPQNAAAAANRISHAAADYFGASYSWHRTDLVPKDVNVGKVDCGVCGEKIQPKAVLCIHCGAPTDPAKQEAWLQKKLDMRRSA